MHFHLVPSLFWPFWMWLAVSIINLLFIFTISFPKQLVHGLLQPETDKFLKQQWLKLWHPFVSCKYHLLYSPVFGINASGKKYVRALQVVIKTPPPETLHWPGLSWILSQLEKFKLLSVSELNGEEIRVGFRLFLGCPLAILIWACLRDCLKLQEIQLD